MTAMRWLASVVAVGLATAARAAPAPKPWAAGVSDAEQTAAFAIYKQANAEFEEARYAQALAMYREAIKHWDHPSIRFNMVVCLVNLDQPLEAIDDLESALKYGADPLGAAVYEQGLTYKKLLLAQLAKLEVASKEPNATITLDGTALFTAPGSIAKLVLPGNHQIVATKPGFLTTTVPLVLVGGRRTVANVVLSRLEPTTIVHRWSVWKPWAIAGGGAVLAIAGAYLEYRSYENYQSYNAGFGQQCATGCGGPTQPPIPAELDATRHRAALQNGAAISMFVVGGLALAAGSIGVYLNQPRALTEKNLTLTPVIGTRGASLVLGGAL